MKEKVLPGVRYSDATHRLRKGTAFSPAPTRHGGAGTTAQSFTTFSCGISARQPDVRANRSLHHRTPTLSQNSFAPSCQSLRARPCNHLTPSTAASSNGKPYTSTGRDILIQSPGLPVITRLLPSVPKARTLFAMVYQASAPLVRRNRKQLRAFCF